MTPYGSVYAQSDHHINLGGPIITLHTRPYITIVVAMTLLFLSNISSLFETLFELNTSLSICRLPPGHYSRFNRISKQ